jgi:hypothetical protein
VAVPQDQAVLADVGTGVLPSDLQQEEPPQQQAELAADQQGQAQEEQQQEQDKEQEEVFDDDGVFLDFALYAMVESLAEPYVSQVGMTDCSSTMSDPPCSCSACLVMCLPCVAPLCVLMVPLLLRQQRCQGGTCA